MKYLVLFLTMFIFSCSDSTVTDSETGQQVQYEHVECLENVDCEDVGFYCTEVLFNEGKEDESRLRECLSDCSTLVIGKTESYRYGLRAGICTKNRLQ